MATTATGGHEKSAETLAAYLDLPSPVHTYSEHLEVIDSGATSIAADSMQKAAEEAKEHFHSNDVTVSVDGTWQRRGFTSKNGVVTVVTNLGKNEANKVIDTKVMTTKCNTCNQHNRDNVKLSTIAAPHKFLSTS